MFLLCLKKSLKDFIEVKRKILQFIHVLSSSSTCSNWKLKFCLLFNGAVDTQLPQIRMQTGEYY